MSNNQETFTWKSADISLVASLLATNKIVLKDCHRISPYRVEFQLSPAKTCAELTQDYINDRLLVSAKRITDNVRLLKDLTRASLPNGGPAC